jgi:predicted CXXCH cytochrome family protein
VSVETACKDCHGDVAELAADGIHAQRIAEGELNAASCADCHGAHEIQDPQVPRWRGSAACAKCHGEIAEQYADSVHGEALLGEGNPDVPVCTDCHGVHDMVDPTTAQFRLSSPQMCGECHADEEMMARYGISTNVFDTYVADFHGTTVTLFQHTSPNEETNKAVCYDCHGIHNIQSPTDENSQVMAANLLTTCQQCHPDANENFTASWMGHYEPSLDKYPIVYLVDLFYKVLIPTVIGGFALFIFSDIYRRVTDRRRSTKGKHE